MAHLMPLEWKRTPLPLFATRDTPQWMGKSRGATSLSSCNPVKEPPPQGRHRYRADCPKADAKVGKNHEPRKLYATFLHRIMKVFEFLYKNTGIAPYTFYYI